MIYMTTDITIYITRYNYIIQLLYPVNYIGSEHTGYSDIISQLLYSDTTTYYMYNYWYNYYIYI